VVFGVLLGGVLVMLHGVQVVAMRDVGMMRGLFVIARLMMLRRLAMVLGRMFMMMRGLLMMLVDVVTGHRSLPGCRLRWKIEASPGSMNHLRSKFVR
jgi:hypothetical protein